MLRPCAEAAVSAARQRWGVRLRWLSEYQAAQGQEQRLWGQRAEWERLFLLEQQSQLWIVPSCPVLARLQMQQSPGLKEPS